CNHRFLALLRNDGELDLTLLDVKNRVRDLSLWENDLILPVFGYRFSLANLGKKFFGIKCGLASLHGMSFARLASRRIGDNSTGSRRVCEGDWTHRVSLLLRNNDGGVASGPKPLHSTTYR